jgi:hypothetical protein
LADAYKQAYGKGGGQIPPEAWTFFGSIDMLNTAEKGNDNAGVQKALWGLGTCVSAWKKPEEKRAFEVGAAIAKRLKPEEREIWYSMCKSDNADYFDMLLSAHPDKTSLVRAQQGAARTPSGIGIMLMCLVQRFEAMQQWQKDFMVQQVSKGANLGFVKGEQVFQVLSPEPFTFMMAKQMIESKQEKVAVELVKSSPANELGNVVNVKEGRNDIVKHSFFDLFCYFEKATRAEAANGLLQYFVDVQAYSDDSFQVFLAQELPDITAFVIQFVTLVRKKVFRWWRRVQRPYGSSGQ